MHEEVRYGLGRHAWVVSDADSLPQLKVRLPSLDLEDVLTPASIFTQISSCTI